MSSSAPALLATNPAGLVVQKDVVARVNRTRIAAPHRTVRNETGAHERVVDQVEIAAISASGVHAVVLLVDERVAGDPQIAVALRADEHAVVALRRVRGRAHRVVRDLADVRRDVHRVHHLGDEVVAHDAMPGAARDPQRRRVAVLLGHAGIVEAIAVEDQRAAGDEDRAAVGDVVERRSCSS